MIGIKGHKYWNIQTPFQGEIIDISESNENVFQESKGKVTDISGSNENVSQESSNQITHN